MTKLLLRIFNNIINNPNKQKYKNLDFNIISKKFSKCPSCINILRCAGFYKSKNGHRLIFDEYKLDKLKKIKNLLLNKITQQKRTTKSTLRLNRQTN